jgi:hypothetical protein
MGASAAEIPEESVNRFPPIGIHQLALRESSDVTRFLFLFLKESSHILRSRLRCRFERAAGSLLYLAESCSKLRVRLELASFAFHYRTPRCILVANLVKTPFKTFFNEGVAHCFQFFKHLQSLLATKLDEVPVFGPFPSI